jgi:phenylacetaldehyde dehydrogenase
MSAEPVPFDGLAISPETQAFLGQPHQLLIGGQWVDGSGEMESRDPATGLRLPLLAVPSKAPGGAWPRPSAPR